MNEKEQVMQVETTEVKLPEKETSSKKVDKNSQETISFKDVFNELDVDDEIKTTLKDKYKPQFANAIASKEAKELKKNLYSEATTIKAEKIAKTMLQAEQERINKEYQEKGYLPLSKEEIEEISNNSAFAGAHSRKVIEDAKNNPIAGAMLRDFYNSVKSNPIVGNTDVGIVKQETTIPLEMTGEDIKDFRDFQSKIKNGGLSSEEANRFQVLKIKHAIKMKGMSLKEGEAMIKKIKGIK